MVSCPKNPGSLRLMLSTCVYNWKKAQEAPKRVNIWYGNSGVIVRPRPECKDCEHGYNRSLQIDQNMELKPRNASIITERMKKPKEAPAEPAKPSTSRKPRNKITKVYHFQSHIFNLPQFAADEGWVNERQMLEQLFSVHKYPVAVAAILGVSFALMHQKVKKYDLKVCDGRHQTLSRKYRNKTTNEN